MAKSSSEVTKIKSGFWSGVGIAVAAIVVGIGFAWLRPKLPVNLPA